MVSDRIKELETQISQLRNLLNAKEDELHCLKYKQTQNTVNHYTCGLTAFEVARYSRQMLIPQFGTEGQKRLRDSHAMIVGAGGLGCPAALYLAAAGVGHISIIDNDEVEISNLHRQILHNEHRVGVSKVFSAQETLKSINSSIRITSHHMHANAQTLPPLFTANHYDVVIDGSDNVATRYLLNDACVLYCDGPSRIPLVSGSALQLEGQLTVYNYENGPCYRCLFPTPPPPDTVTSCGDGGVLGGVPGLIGVLQAIETIKIVCKMGNVLCGRFLIFDAIDTTFRNVKLRNKDKTCQLCSEVATITTLIDYERFCGAKSDDKVHNIDILEKSSNVSVDILRNIPKNSLIIDVRPSIEFDMCHIEKTLNFPYDNMKKSDKMVFIRKMLDDFFKDTGNDEEHKQVHLLCRRGNDSQRALVLLNEQISDLNIKFLNITGGLHRYAKEGFGHLYLFNLKFDILMTLYLGNRWKELAENFNACSLYISTYFNTGIS